MVDWAKLNSPEYKEEQRRREEEKSARLQLMDEWRKITVGATGHRSDRMGGYYNALGGYDRNHPIVVQLRQATLEVLEDLIVTKNMSRFISGGALGYDTLFFWCVHHLKKKYPHIQNILAVPFLNQWTAWVKTLPLAVEWYHKMVEAADEVIDVARHPDYTTRENERSKNPIPLDDYSKDKMFNRNDYMVDQLAYLTAFLMDPKSGTGHAVRKAQRGIGNRPNIIRLDPRYGCKPEYF